MIELLNTHAVAAAALALGAGLSAYAVVGFALHRRAPASCSVAEPAAFEPVCVAAVSRALRLRPVVPLRAPRLIVPETVH